MKVSITQINETIFVPDEEKCVYRECSIWNSLVHKAPFSDYSQSFIVGDGKHLQVGVHEDDPNYRTESQSMDAQYWIFG